MLNTSWWQPVWEIASHLAVAAGVFDGVFLCCPFSHDMSWMRSGTSLSQSLTVFLPTLSKHVIMCFFMLCAIHSFIRNYLVTYTYIQDKGLAVG